MMKAHDSEHRRLRRTRAEKLRARIRANVAVAELASELAHQLNNPLEGLTNLLYLAKKSARDDELQTLLDVAESQLARVSAVVRSILTLQGSDPQQRLQAAGEMLSPEAFRRMKEEYESALHLASVVEGAQDAIYSKKLDGTIMAWNPEAERLFGYPAAEALGRSVRMLVPAELMEEEWEILEQVRTGKRVARYETIRKAKDGRRLRVSISISPIYNPGGKVVGASSIATDITAEESS
jgi:PAS domain S-box-containing protein